MILIGMFDSPFVRRVAVSMHLLDIAFEHRNRSVGKDFDRIREFNPLGRVPTLVLPSGPDRRAALQLIVTGSGAAEKGVSQIYETAFRPESKRHPPWVERCRTQMHAGLAVLDRHAAKRTGHWLVGDRMTQADISVTCVYTFLCLALGIAREGNPYPSLASAAARCEALPVFRSVPPGEFLVPSS